MTLSHADLDNVPQFKGLGEDAREKIRKILNQREEVCDAFVARYGFEPERFVQVNRQTPTGQEWSVRRKTDEEMSREVELQTGVADKESQIANLKYLLQQSVKYLKYDAEAMGDVEAKKLLGDIKNATRPA